MNQDLVPQQNPPPSPVIGASSQDEGESSNSGAATASAALQLSAAVELDTLRARLAAHHQAAIEELERLWREGAPPEAMTTAVARLINEAEVFSSRLLSAQMNLTLFATRQSKQKK